MQSVKIFTSNTKWVRRMRKDEMGENNRTTTSYTRGEAQSVLYSAPCRVSQPIGCHGGRYCMIYMLRRGTAESRLVRG